VVAEEHSLCRVGLAHLLKSRAGFSKVVACKTIGETLEAVSAGDHSLLAIAYDLPGLDQVTGLRSLRKAWPTLQIVVISETCDRKSIIDVLSAGAQGLIPKGSASQYVEHALKIIAGGDIFVPDLLSEDSAQVRTEPKSCRAGVELTTRQREVLRLLAAGSSNKEIARALQISEGTVKVHVNASFRTLGVHNRVSAASAMREIERGTQTWMLSSPTETRDTEQLDLLKVLGGP
jgi:DNA-binding NarL/FixJ family response regulator